METVEVEARPLPHTSMQSCVLIWPCPCSDLLCAAFDRQADLVDISAATDIHGTPFDEPANPIAVSGVLNPSITPATYVPFVNYLNTTQLAKFGLHNGAVVLLSLVMTK